MGYRNDRGDRRGGRGDRGPREMFSAVCDKCGKDCEVPFKPSGNKPVLCSDCFEGTDGRGREGRVNNRQLDEKIDEKIAQLDAKLDAIIERLDRIEDRKVARAEGTEKVSLS